MIAGSGWIFSISTDIFFEKPLFLSKLSSGFTLRFSYLGIEAEVNACSFQSDPALSRSGRLTDNKSKFILICLFAEMFPYLIYYILQDPIIYREVFERALKWVTILGDNIYTDVLALQLKVVLD